MPRNAVCLCPDAKWLVPALVVADRARSSAGSSRYDVVVLAVPSAVGALHRRWMEARGIQFRPIENVPESVLAVRSTFAHWSHAGLHRLIIPRRVADDYDRLLYLDCDVVLESPLSDVFGLDLQGCGMAAVRDLPYYLQGATERSGYRLEKLRRVVDDPARYFNTGVLLIDVRRWCAEDIGSRALQYLERHPVGGLRDQNVLNSLFDGRYAELSPLWNLQVRGYRPLRLGDFVRPVVWHFTGRPKPWMRFAAGRGPLSPGDDYRRYREVLRATPWGSWLRRQWGWSDLFRNLQSEVVRRIDRRRPPGELSPRARRIRTEVFRQYCLETPFIDVAQGVTRRTPQQLALTSAT